MDPHTEDDYYHHIAASLEEDENPVIDHVAGPIEWRRFKAAMLRWLTEQEQKHIEGLDELAREQEHDA